MINKLNDKKLNNQQMHTYILNLPKLLMQGQQPKYMLKNYF